ncbi:Transposase [Abeliophyllum distichum]|uniref:Transposase n=1 Tax=Abeliophyllum distichum TaxID=126358 RepID=A0ABD1VU41_9LAMI
MANIMYLHRHTQYIDWVDSDYLSRFELNTMPKCLGYNFSFIFAYRIPNMNLTNGLLRLMTDRDVLCLIKDLSKSRTIEVYVVTYPEVLTLPWRPHKENVVITELDLGT